MSQRHYFEFLDLPWLPRSLKHAMTDLLDFQLSDLTSYSDWAARSALEAATRHGCRRIVECGAGAAPITRRLAESAPAGMELVPCDLSPDRAGFGALAERFPGRVKPVFEPVDFCERRSWGDGTLVLVSAAFHHVPPERRTQALRNLRASAAAVLICEPLRRTPLGLAYALAGLLVDFAGPLVVWRPGAARRALWCWVVPAAPLLLTWDGIVSCLRMWPPERWSEALAAAGARGAVDLGGWLRHKVELA